jgi:outer membrane protein OmpA-like peptidoglycan-associated protein
VATPPPQVGRPATPDEIPRQDAANDLSPEKSVERLDKYGKYLLGTVSTVGTVLTGFGIFSPSASGTASNPWFLLPVGLACLSLAFATVAITPVFDEIKPAYEDTIREHYRKLIRRGRFVTWAGWLFAGSLGSAAVVVAVQAGLFAPLIPQVSLTWARTDAGPELTTSVKFEKVPRSAIIKTSIFGLPPDDPGKPPTLLFDDISRPDFGGKVQVSSKLDHLGPLRSLVLIMKVSTAAEILYQDRMEITVPAPPIVVPADKIVLRGVHFDFGKAMIRPDAAAVLDEAASALKQHPGLTIHVDGYCDAIASDEYNFKLSRKRADAVAKYLEDHGIAPSRLVARGFGKTNFVASNETEQGRAQNRRVELTPVE